MKIKFSILDKSIVKNVTEQQAASLLLTAHHGIMGTGEDATAKTMEDHAAFQAGKAVTIGVYTFQRV